MHDVSIGKTIEDYLTGEELDATTYEDLRQALARILVEEKGYPRERLEPRVKVDAPIDDKTYTRIVDLAVRDDDQGWLLILLFCPGVVATYTREALAAARLMPGAPARLVAVTDTKDALLLSVADGRQIAEGFGSLPTWERLKDLAGKHPPLAVDPERREREARILYAYSESLYACCGGAACAAEEKGGRFSKGK